MGLYTNLKLGGAPSCTPIYLTSSQHLPLWSDHWEAIWTDSVAHLEPDESAAETATVVCLYPVVEKRWEIIRKP